MRRVAPIAAALVVVVAMCSWSVSAFAATTTGSQPRALVVMATGLTWEDITETGTPTLWRLASEGAVGNLNARPRAREAAEPVSAYEGGLDISAGNWTVPDFRAEGAYDATEPVQGTTAVTAYERINAMSMVGHAVTYLGFPAVVRANAASPDEPAVGTLGQAVVDAGGSTSAIGNSDAGDPDTGFKIERPAAVAAMDGQGLVLFGDVSRDLLTESLGSPYGLHTDLPALGSKLSACEASAAAHGGPALIVLDPGDEYRARRYAVQASDAEAAAQHVRAVRETDDVVAMALRHARPSDVVVVATEGPADSISGIRGFSPVFVSGGGLHGYLTSSSTHRTGTVANPDITAFVLHALGIARPVEVIGNRFLATSAPDSSAQRVAYLSARNWTAVSIDAIRGQSAEIFIKVFIAVFAVAAGLVATRRQLRSRHVVLSSRILKGAALMFVAVLAAGWAMFLVTRNVFTASEAWLSLLGTASVLLVLAIVVWRSLGGRVALAAMMLFTFGLLLIDQLLGGPLSFTNLVGYTPLQSARYYGIGNEAAALLVGTALVGSALVLDLLKVDSGLSIGLRRWGIPVLGAICVVAAAAPMFGANVGVAIWGTAGFGVLWIRANGKRITWKHALATLVVAVLLIGAFAAVDLLHPGEKTHLARSLSSAEQGGVAQLWIIVARKAQTNARLLTLNNWSAMLAAVLAFLAFMRLRSSQDLTRAIAENPGLGAVISAGLAAAVLALLTEDTGILVSTFVMLPVGLEALWLILSAVEAEQGRA
jgi:hypothetical protein